MLRGDVVSLDVGTGAAIWAISDTAAQTLCILESAK